MSAVQGRGRKVIKSPQHLHNKLNSITFLAEYDALNNIDLTAKYIFMLCNN